MDKDLRSPPSRNGMPRKGDIFRGRVINLGKWDSSGWRCREIHFLRHDINRKQLFSYPRKGNQIVLIDTNQTRYELNFSKPENSFIVCLGTVSRLKPWYQKKGFEFDKVIPGKEVYFEYTGYTNEFLLFTAEEYRRKYSISAPLNLQ